MNETHLQTTKRWSVPAYIIYRSEGHRRPHGGTDIVVKSSIRHNKANLPHFTALKVTAVNILNRTENLTIGAVYAPPSPPLFAQVIMTLTQYNQLLYICWRP
jgi:hypothetical protein